MDFVFEPILDKDGFIIDYKLSEKALEQSIVLSLLTETTKDGFIAHSHSASRGMDFISGLFS